MAKYNTFKSALNYEGKLLTNYKYQIDIQAQLLDKIKSALPENLCEHALYCIISGKKVTLYTDSAIWSSQLRFYHQHLLQALSSANLCKTETLQIKIIPKTMTQKEATTITPPSSKNIDFILNQAENMADKKLKAALLKLGTTLKSISNSIT